MRNFAYKYLGEEEYTNVPYMVNVDNQKMKTRNTRKNLMTTCNILSLVWTLSLSFMAQLVIPQEALADTYSVLLILVAVMQVVGWK